MEQADLLRLVLSLSAVVVFILVAAWVARRSGLIRPKGQAIQIIATQAIGPRAQLLVVEVDNQRLLLGVNPQQIQLLHHFSEQASFDKTLQSALSSPAPQSRE